jgi:predicted secreted Zn-dependent protease
MRAGSGLSRCLSVCAAILAALWAGPTRAQLYSEDGPPERLRIHLTQHEVVLDAPDLASLRMALNESQRFRGHGLTHTRLEVRQQLLDERSNCRLIDHQVRAEITVSLPRWQPPEPLSERQQGNWPQASAALQAHEAIHVEHAQQAARNLDAAMATLRQRAYPDCDTLKRVIERARQRVLIRFEIRDALFDQVTDFGRKTAAPEPAARRRDAPQRASVSRSRPVLH